MKQINTRISMKHDVEAVWNSEPAKTIVPYSGELIIYDAETLPDGTQLPLPADRTTPISFPRLKVGDGKTSVVDLPFVTSEESISDDEIDEICNHTLNTYLDLIASEEEAF